MDPRHFVIVGGGTCAGSAASTLRAEGFDGAVTIVSNEPMPPYECPPLSKDYLPGKTAAEDLAVNPAGWYAGHDVELLLDTHATRLDTARATLTLGEGRDLHYDALLLATGGRPRQLPDLASDRVLYLRGITDAQRLAQQLCTGERVVVLGGGFIGCEVAASARGLGLEVTVLEMPDVPLQRVLGPDLGEIVAQIHRDAGVEVRTGERVRARHRHRPAHHYRPQWHRLRRTARGRRAATQQRTRPGRRNRLRQRDPGRRLLPHRRSRRVCRR